MMIYRVSVLIDDVYQGVQDLRNICGLLFPDAILTSLGESLTIEFNEDWKYRVEFSNSRIVCKQIRTNPEISVDMLHLSYVQVVDTNLSDSGVLCVDYLKILSILRETWAHFDECAGAFNEDRLATNVRTGSTS